MRYGCVSPTPEMEDMRRSPSESSDASFEIVSAETVNESQNEVSSFKPSVTFRDIFDVYPMDSDIVARVSLGNDFEISSDDVVIVVPLAWTSVDQAVCSSKLTGNYVRFDVNDLPKAPADQFYQLCYCATQAKNIVGVSAPFFFREVHEDELMEFQKEHNKEFWTFRSRFAVLTDLYWNSVEKNNKIARNDDPPQHCDRHVASESCENVSFHSDSKIKCADSVEMQIASVTVDQKLAGVEEDSSDSYKTSDDTENKLIRKISNGSISAESGRDISTRQQKSEIHLVDEGISRVEISKAEKLEHSKYLEKEKTYQDQESEYKVVIAKLQRQLDEKNSEILRAENEILAMKEHENFVSTKLVNQFKTIKNLVEEHAVYKKSMENRLKACAKEYSKMYLKLRPLNVPSHN